MDPEIIAEQLDLWPDVGPVKITLINLSENHTFRLDGADASRRILRVHRLGYQDGAAIRSELAWMQALHRDTDVLVPQPIAGINGDLVQRLRFDSEATQRYAVMFAFNKGVSPQEGDPHLADLFEQLGEIAAKCHLQVQNWQVPNGFVRPTWNVASMLSEAGLWGDWRQAPNLTGDFRQVLEAAQGRLAEVFELYGANEDNFGLIHADMRLANFLVHEWRIRLLDFDDSGFGWFIYDFAAAVSFFEDSARIPVLKARWLDGYRRYRALNDADMSMMDAAILLRRMLLLAWVGSHGETELAQSHAQNFAANTVKLAEKYLRGEPLS